MNFFTFECKPGPGRGERTWRIGWFYPLVLVALFTVPMLATECSGTSQQQQMSQWQALGEQMQQNITDTEQQLLALVDFRWTMDLSHSRRSEIVEAAHDLTLSEWDEAIESTL